MKELLEFSRNGW